MPGSFAGFTGFRVIRQRLEQAWALAHYTKKNQLPLGDGSWLKKGGIKKRGISNFYATANF